MTKHQPTTRGASARALLAAVAITPLMLSACGGLSKSDLETIDIPPAPAGTEVPAAGAGAPNATATNSTPAVASEPAPPPYSLEDAEKYVIQSGDSLSQIAAKHGVSMRDIKRANNLTDVNKIRAGQTLLLPAKTAASPDDATGTEATTTTPGAEVPEVPAVPATPPVEADASAVELPGLPSAE